MVLGHACGKREAGRGEVQIPRGSRPELCRRRGLDPGDLEFRAGQEAAGFFSRNQVSPPSNRARQDMVAGRSQSMEMRRVAVLEIAGFESDQDFVAPVPDA